jgi:hypothetical protein
VTGTGRGGGGETSPPRHPTGKICPHGTMCHPGHPGVQVRGGPGSHARAAAHTPSRPSARAPEAAAAAALALAAVPTPKDGAEPRRQGGGGAGARLWESPGAGGVCVGTRLCGPWSLVPRGRCVEAAEYGLLYDFVRDLPRPPGEARSTPVTGTWPGKSACPDGARPILPTTVSFHRPGPPARDGSRCRRGRRPARFRQTVHTRPRETGHNRPARDTRPRPEATLAG